MSKINGEKARFAAARKKKLRHRVNMRALRAAVATKKAPEPEVKA
ncbi:MAG TPA: hypothetical protein VKH46_12690 [Thermoanaerobaculia bacterium]|jgi:hypothetical protein|nr:hypothetical protein [Thermoanaerobaculia bacterium]